MQDEILLTAAILLAVGASLVLALSYVTYKLTFFNKHKNDFNVFYSIEKTPPPPHAKLTRGLITRLLAEPCEPHSRPRA